jgi:transketolase
VHGSPLGDEDLANVKIKYGFNPEDKFVVADDVYAFYRERAAAGAKAEADWNTMFAKYVPLRVDNLSALIGDLGTRPSTPIRRMSTSVGWLAPLKRVGPRTCPHTRPRASTKRPASTRSMPSLR